MKNLQTFREPVKIDSASQIVVYGNQGTENQARNQEAITGLCWASLLKPWPPLVGGSSLSRTDCRTRRQGRLSLPLSLLSIHCAPPCLYTSCVIRSSHEQIRTHFSMYLCSRMKLPPNIVASEFKRRLTIKLNFEQMFQKP